MAIGDATQYYDFQEIPLRIDEVSTTLTYVGYVQNIGASESGAIWKIKKIQQTGTVWKITYADGDQLFDNVWSDRASLTYR